MIRRVNERPASTAEQSAANVGYVGGGCRSEALTYSDGHLNFLWLEVS